MRLLLVCAVALVAAGSAAADVPVRATLTTSSTRALVGVPWTYTIDVRGLADGPVDARVKLQVLARLVNSFAAGPGSRSIACTSARSASGSRSGAAVSSAIVWPARLAGSRLTFRVLVATGTREPEPAARP